MLSLHGAGDALVSGSGYFLEAVSGAADTDGATSDAVV